MNLTRRGMAVGLAASVVARPDDGWLPIETAPTDGRFVRVKVAAYLDLPGFECYAGYNECGGWCCDELRPTTHWRP